MSNLVSAKDDTISPNNADLQSDLPVGKKVYKYHVISNNPALNSMARINGKANSHKRPAGGGYEQKWDAVTAITKKLRLGRPESQMLDYLNWNFINNDQNQTFILTLDQMIADFKLGDRERRSAYRNIRTRLDKLTQTSYIYTGGYTPKDKNDKRKLYDRNFNSGNHPLFEYDYQGRAGIFTITLSDFLYDLFLNAMIMPYFLKAFELDPIKDGVAIAILRELSINKKQNYGKPRADRMKMTTLLPKLKGLIPSKEGAHRHVQKRIIDVIFDQTDLLAQGDNRVFDDYQILDGNNKPADPTNYGELLECQIYIKKWHAYPSRDVEKLQEQQLQHRIDYQKKKVSVLQGKLAKLQANPRDTTEKTIRGIKEDLEDAQNLVHTSRAKLRCMKDQHKKLEQRRTKKDK